MSVSIRISGKLLTALKTGTHYDDTWTHTGPQEMYYKTILKN